ncbi:MAG: GNAT family N-acetyltransferase [Chloroflexota bacterium]
MEITLREIDSQTVHCVNQCDATFTIRSKLILHAENGIIRYTAVDVEPYQKKYPIEEVDYSTYIGNPDKTIFFAYIDDHLAGQVRVLKWWNAYAYIDDIAVDVEFRRHGVGRALIERVIEWAKERKFPGIMLETQNNNVAACRLYESCGFTLGGFDRYLYKALDPKTDEIALFWYMSF